MLGAKHRTQAWISIEHAASHYATGSVAWCNGRKADRTPEEAVMPLLYLPYVPSRFEDFLLAGRNIRADVHDWLAARLPRTSRLN